MTIDRISHNIHRSISNASAARENSSFSALLEQAKCNNTKKNHAHMENTQFKGDYLSSFKISQPTEADIKARPQGMAVKANTKNEKIIDKTSELYQTAQELESYLVKIMLNSMRSTLGKTNLTGKNSFAGNMYKDMIYEELSRNVTKNAGFGLADQMYAQLT